MPVNSNSVEEVSTLDLQVPQGNPLDLQSVSGTDGSSVDTPTASEAEPSDQDEEPAVKVHVID